MQTDRQTNKQANRQMQTDRQTNKQTEIPRQTDTKGRQTNITDPDRNSVIDIIV